MVKFIDHLPDANDLNREVAELSTHGNDAFEQVNGATNAANDENEGPNKKRKSKDRKPKEDGRRPMKKRRHSLSKAARDPRDEASPVEPDVGTRSPSPVIDFDGLSRPSKFSPSLNRLLPNSARPWNPGAPRRTP